MLEQVIYQVPREQRQKVYQVRDLEYLSATQLYGFDSGPLKPLLPSKPLREPEPLGSSRYFTWLSDPQPGPDLEIITPKSYEMVNTEGVIPTSRSSLAYFNSRGEVLGGIQNINYEEISVLLRKHFGKK